MNNPLTLGYWVWHLLPFWSVSVYVIGPHRLHTVLDTVLSYTCRTYYALRVGYTGEPIDAVCLCRLVWAPGNLVGLLDGGPVSSTKGFFFFGGGLCAGVA